MPYYIKAPWLAPPTPEDTEEEKQRKQKQQADRFLNPLEDFTIKDAMLLALYSRLAKTPQGMKVLQEMIKGVFDTTQALAQASATNPIVAWANPVLISEVFNRFGLVNPYFIPNYHLGITVISGVTITEDFVDTVLGALPWAGLKAPEEAPFPSTIVYDAREAGVELPEKITWKELIELAKAKK